jgi:uncharacterized protein (DUF1501 family)
MERRKFLALTGTFTGGALLLPDFLYSFAKQDSLVIGEQCLVFIQLNGGNDGLNTFIPYEDPLYYNYRSTIGIPKNDVIASEKGMGFHPSLASFAQIQQDGNLSVVQNVGYPQPVRSHFRSQEIWQTGSAADQYLTQGWLGRYLDLQCKEHDPVAGINIDGIDNLALKGNEANSITVRDPGNFQAGKAASDKNAKLSENPQLDFVRRLAGAAYEGSEDIRSALSKSTPPEVAYPKSDLARKLEWISKLIKGNLNSKVYYTSMGGYDTHDNQLSIQAKNLSMLNEAVFSFYTDLKKAGLMQNVTLVIFSEFGRRVQDNGRGTDHGTAAPMFIVGGNSKGKIIGSNPNLADLDNGDLKYETDFRSVYASLLKQKLDFDYRKIGIDSTPLQGLF